MKNKLKALFNRLAKHSCPENKPVYIETPRLVIREIRKDDLERLHQITSTPGFFYCYFDGTRKTVEDFVDRAIKTQNPDTGKRTEYLLAVAEKESGKLVGHVSLESENLLKDYTHSANFFMDPQYQNIGYGRECAINIMKYAIEDLGMPGFSVTIDPKNAPSLRVAQTQGYVKVGETTLNTTRGVEPRLILILKKETFYTQRKHDKQSYILPKKPQNDNNRLRRFFKGRKP